MSCAARIRAIPVSCLHALAYRATRLLSVHAHNERERVAEVLERLGRGEKVALVSDAGTPALSDPGELLISAAIAAGHKVTTVPGPSAAVSALVVAGSGPHAGDFEGFLPRKGPSAPSVSPRSRRRRTRA